MVASRLGELDGLCEFDRRRPMTPSGTNLLGLVKHLTGIELGYLGESVGRPGPSLPWFAHGTVWANGDMWAKPDESSDHCDIMRELIDGHSSSESLGDDETQAAYLTQVTDAAESFR